MQKTFKKTLSVILTLLMIMATIPFVFAAEHSHGEVLFKRTVNEDETAFCTVYEDRCAVVEGEGYADFSQSDWWMLEEGYSFGFSTIYIGAGITDIINASSNMNFTIDENNPYLSTDNDGSIYNKDKTELILYTGDQDCYTVASSVRTLRSGCFTDCFIPDLTLPDSIETIEPFAFEDCYVNYLELPDTLKVIPEGAFYRINCEALVIPSSVEKIEDYAFDEDYFLYTFGDTVLFVMNPECEIGHLGKNIKLIGYSGSTAEKYANENSVSFDYLDKEHKHIFLPRITKLNTCTEDGIITYNCPCGNAEPYERVYESHGHSMDYDNPADDGNVYCEYCGMKADCKCICHKVQKGDASAFEVLIYKIYTFFWKLFRINEYCACGNNAHY